MRIYLDACCLSRLTDDQSQQRIREEASAIEQIFEQIHLGACRLISSEALQLEVSRNPSTERRLEAEGLLASASETIAIGTTELARAKFLERVGYGAYDAVHLAAAEAGNADVLLSTDDKFLRQAARRTGSPRVPVQNPVSWIQEHSP